MRLTGPRENDRIQNLRIVDVKANTDNRGVFEVRTIHGATDVIEIFKNNSSVKASPQASRLCRPYRAGCLQGTPRDATASPVASRKGQPGSCLLSSLRRAWTTWPRLRVRNRASRKCRWATRVQASGRRSGGCQKCRRRPCGRQAVLQALPAQLLLPAPPSIAGIGRRGADRRTTEQNREGWGYTTSSVTVAAGASRRRLAFLARRAIPDAAAQALNAYTASAHAPIKSGQQTHPRRRPRGPST